MVYKIPMPEDIKKAIEENDKIGIVDIWIPVEILDDKNLNITDKLLYGAIAHFGNFGCWQKSESLQKRCGLKKDEFKNSCKRLKDYGYITEQAKYGRIYRRVIK